MKSNLLTKLAALGITLAAAATAFADVKIKSRQTVSGQAMENTTMIKGKRQRTETMNGMMVSVTQCDMQRSIQINTAAQTYQIAPFDDAATNNSSIQNPNSKIPNQKGGTITMLVTNKDTGERKQMFGYPAKHIITTMEMNSSPDACNLTKSKMQFDGWYIDADFALECDQNRRYANYQKPASGGCEDKFDTKTVGTVKKGYPVWEKMTMFDDAGKESFSSISEVVELSKATLNASLFDVPADYREVKDATELYAGYGNAGKMPANMPSDYGNGATNNAGADSGMSQNIKSLSQSKSSNTTAVGAKKEGTIRIGMAGVKTGTVGEGLNAQELAAAIQNTLGEYLKGSRVELVTLEATPAAAQDAEAREKQCDFVLYATVSHKKGGGGFGMFKSIAPIVSSVIPAAGGTGGGIKPKDEITLDIKLQNGSTAALTKQYKAKAKSAGEDIISPLIEQAAQAIINATAK